MATTYYVAKTGSDSNSGLAGFPWLTCQKAADTMVAGDTVNVAVGTYNEQCRTKAAGTSGNSITFDGGGLAILRGFALDHDWTVVNNFRFTWIQDAGGVASIHFIGDNVRITNNVIYEGQRRALWTANFAGTEPAVADWPTNAYIGYNSIIGLIGINTAQLLTMNNSIMEYNTADNCTSDWLTLWGDDNIIRKNRITNFPQDLVPPENHIDFIQTWGHGVSPPSLHSRLNLIEGNYVANFYGQLSNLEMKNEEPFAENREKFRDWTWRNNVFINTVFNNNAGLPGAKWYNNTFYKVGTTGANPLSWANLINSYSAGGIVKNNLFISCGYQSGPTDFLAWYAGITNTINGYEANYNMVAGLVVDGWATPGSPVNSDWPGVWVEVNGIAGIGAGVPMFVDAAGGDVRLATGSPAIGTGVDLTSEGFSTDINGAARTPGAWDIGAYKFLALANPDLDTPATPRYKYRKRRRGRWR